MIAAKFDRTKLRIPKSLIRLLFICCRYLVVYTCLVDDYMLTFSDVYDMKDLNRTKQKLIIQRYSTNTISTYMACLRSFFQYFKDTEPKELHKTDILNYLESLIQKGYSKSSQNQHINAIKFYYEKVLGKKREFYYLERPRKDKKLPVVLSKEEVQRLFQKSYNLKHKTILAIIYSCGLRVSEMINMKITDIDYERNTIWIRNSKSNKDRQVLGFSNSRADRKIYSSL